MSVATSSAVLAPIVESECMLKYVEELNAIVEAETERRERFYDEMTDAEKVEFINGEVIVHSPAMSGHTLARINITMMLTTYVDVRDLGMVQDEKCLCVFPRNDYEPDVVYFGESKAALIDNKTMKHPVPDLVVEVLSESTERRDRGLKLRDYSANGVGEYWIVDSNEKLVEQYLQLDGELQLVLKSSDGMIESSVVSGFKIPIAAIFDKKLRIAEVTRLASEDEVS